MFPICPFSKCPDRRVTLLNNENIVNHLIDVHKCPVINVDQNSVVECRVGIVLITEGFVPVSCLFEYKGLYFLLCASWGYTFECWIWKLEEESNVLDGGMKLEWKMALKYGKKPSHNKKDKQATKESVFPLKTTPWDICETVTGLSTTFKQMQKKYLTFLAAGDIFCTVKVAVKEINIGLSPKVEIVQYKDHGNNFKFKCPKCSHLLKAVKLESSIKKNKILVSGPSKSFTAAVTSKDPPLAGSNHETPVPDSSKSVSAATNGDCKLESEKGDKSQDREISDEDIVAALKGYDLNDPYTVAKLKIALKVPIPKSLSATAIRDPPLGPKLAVDFPQSSTTCESVVSDSLTSASAGAGCDYELNPRRDFVKVIIYWYNLMHWTTPFTEEDWLEWETVRKNSVKKQTQ